MNHTDCIITIPTKDELEAQIIKEKSYERFNINVNDSKYVLFDSHENIVLTIMVLTNLQKAFNNSMKRDCRIRLDNLSLDQFEIVSTIMKDLGYTVTGENLYTSCIITL